MNPFVISIDKLNFNNAAYDVDEWFINENLDLDYFSALASDSVPSDTSTDVHSDHVSAMHALTSLHALIRSSFMMHGRASGTHWSFFKCQPNVRSQSYLEESSLNQ